MSRAHIAPIEESVSDHRQSFARHYGVHPYFTRRSANLLRAYISRYTERGDVVLDPFGGSGVTAIEAFLLGRIGIQNDINPFANFMAQQIAETSLPDVKPIYRALDQVREQVLPDLELCESASDSALRTLRSRVNLPENIALPRSSDARFFHDLFTQRQLIGLAILKDSIDCIADPRVKAAMLLAWSASAAKLNRTFISTTGRAASRGGSSIFSIYRYKVAKNPLELPIWNTFSGRVKNVIKAKEEVMAIRDFERNRMGNAGILDSAVSFRVYSEDAASLPEVIKPESVDYIFTDPPYGAYIAYLDLSILWNHWLGFPVSRSDHDNEIIVGGSQNHTEAHYKDRLAKSIAACVNMLKPDRWMSVVFQHWDTSYFETILGAATSTGTELRAAVTQEREVIWSMHKKKNREGLLAGEMILTFYKPKQRAKKRTAVRERRPRLFAVMLREILVEEGGKVEATSQYFFNRIILRAWREHSISELSVTKEEFAQELRNHGWIYDAGKHVWRREGARLGQQTLWAETAKQLTPTE